MRVIWVTRRPRVWNRAPMGRRTGGRREGGGLRVPTVLALGLVLGTAKWGLWVICFGPESVGWRWVIFGLGWPVLPALSMTLLAGPMLRKASGLEARWSREELARYLAGSVLSATLIPGLSVALLGFAYEESRVGSVLPVVLAAVVWLVAVLATWGPVREMRVPGSLVPFPDGPRREEAFRLARRMDVPLRHLFLAQTRRSKIAGAYALGRKRVVLSDALLAVLDPQELQAVLAHELRHLTQQGRAARLFVWGALLGIGSPTLVWIASRGLADGPRYGLTGACVVMSLVVLFRSMVRLKRRQEDEADEAAVAFVGAAPLITAIAKVAAANGSRSDRGTARYRSLIDRSTRIGHLGGLAPDEVARLSDRSRGDQSWIESPKSISRSDGVPFGASTMPS